MMAADEKTHAPAHSHGSADIDGVAARVMYELGLSELTNNALRVGELAPEFELANGLGFPFRFERLLACGPAVVSFYHGGWCTFCRQSLLGLQRTLGQVEAAGAALVAISPESPEELLETALDNALGFELLSDAENRVARLYGLVHPKAQALTRLYESLGLAVPEAAMRTGLPLPATYVVGRDGIATFAFLEPDFSRRADPGDVLAALRRASGGG
ncbi:MAG: peroxiredoxin-like family protein [Alphaproteobacteria bacterium]